MRIERLTYLEGEFVFVTVVSVALVVKRSYAVSEIIDEHSVASLVDIP